MTSFGCQGNKYSPRVPLPNLEQTKPLFHLPTMLSASPFLLYLHRESQYCSQKKEKSRNRFTQGNQLSLLLFSSLTISTKHRNSFPLGHLATGTCISWNIPQQEFLFLGSLSMKSTRPSGDAPADTRLCHPYKPIPLKQKIS